jgi:hypothetical protein
MVHVVVARAQIGRVTPVTLSRTYMWPYYAPDGRLPSGTNRLSRGELPDSGLTFVRVDFGDDP